MAKNKRIIIPFTENDIEDLRSGVEFEWTFPVEGKPDEWVDVLIKQEEQSDE